MVYFQGAIFVSGRVTIGFPKQAFLNPYFWNILREINKKTYIWKFFTVSLKSVWVCKWRYTNRSYLSTPNFLPKPTCWSSQMLTRNSTTLDQRNFKRNKMWRIHKTLHTIFTTQRNVAHRNSISHMYIEVLSTSLLIPWGSPHPPPTFCTSFVSLLQVLSATSGHRDRVTPSANKDPGKLEAAWCTLFSLSQKIPFQFAYLKR